LMNQIDDLAKKMGFAKARVEGIVNRGASLWLPCSFRLGRPTSGALRSGSITGKPLGERAWSGVSHARRNMATARRGDRAGARAWASLLSRRMQGRARGRDDDRVGASRAERGESPAAGPERKALEIAPELIGRHSCEPAELFERGLSFVPNGESSDHSLEPMLMPLIVLFQKRSQASERAVRAAIETQGFQVRGKLQRRSACKHSRFGGILILDVALVICSVRCPHHLLEISSNDSALKSHSPPRELS
jgi:hypothetical protein